MLFFVSKEITLRGRNKFTQRRNKHVINFYSNKNECHIWCESFLERDYALLLEFDESVQSFSSQTEYFNVFGKRYTPDFCVLYASGLTEYVEVKHTTFLDDAFFEAHALRQHSIYQETRSCLKLFSENEICVPSLDNLRLLNRYRQLDVKHILPLLNLKTKKMKFKALENAISRLDGASRAHAWGLVAQHYFVFDNSSPITPDTVIQRNF